ncbi:MAG: type IV pilin N-terminal domain-containing protein [Candidatus Hadarchaeales archaeon]
MNTKGVSPVVGVILLIAITVTLVGIVATLVGGLGGKGTPPSLTMSVKAENGTGNWVILRITHTGGDSVSLSDIIVKAGDDEANMGENRSLSGVLSVGNTVVVGVNCPTDYRGDNIITVYVIHKPSNQMLYNNPNIVVEASS